MPKTLNNVINISSFLITRKAFIYLDNRKKFIYIYEYILHINTYNTKI